MKFQFKISFINFKVSNRVLKSGGGGGGGTLEPFWVSMLQLMTNLKINYLEIAKIWLEKFCILKFKISYLTQFFWDTQWYSGTKEMKHEKANVKMTSNFRNYMEAIDDYAKDDW